MWSLYIFPVLLKQVLQFLQQQIYECKQGKKTMGGETNPLYTIAYEVKFFSY